eukprot:Gregarina_sp_Poly_1__10210@NODE_707_length_6679_cov_285_720357_g534_i0_p1_GENE_NODE_707_length_6679_cov_285_720357_g534_i0NODE_707_length_6679_cov_285_720357_g534_i0_p1_ORF_typecomplete_len731_score99_56Peptidase_M24/PF00557_24/6_2e02Peptidase_M24/PF00557_24/1_3e49Creatinase_N_2/PF16189_5/1_9Creatinase_N_2/PF16189_5/1_1e38Creatinase_N/PF01321_18/3_4e23Creatinase_N/PF01321_18/0_098Peptidase_M24_C/PF16188_5/1_8e18Phage_int_SAM_1/PF02899_17/0_14_NODE_707_length_6679_cov_285_720357_g534_i033495541
MFQCLHKHFFALKSRMQTFTHLIVIVAKSRMQTFTHLVVVIAVNVASLVCKELDPVLKSHSNSLNLEATRFYAELFCESNSSSFSCMESEAKGYSAMEKLNKLRAQMAKFGLDAYWVPSGDAHDSEEPVAADARRRYISNFTGSAGSAIIGSEQAWLWTDGRYFLQAEEELDASCWILMRSGTSGVPKMSDFVKNSTFKNVGFDPFLHTNDWLDDMKKNLAGTEIHLVPIHEGTTEDNESLSRCLDTMEGIEKGELNLVDLVWDEEGTRPQYPAGEILPFATYYQGKDAGEKLTAVRDKMKSEDTNVLILAALDDIAWLFNLRGSDPVNAREFLSYAVVTTDTASVYVKNSEAAGRLSGATLDILKSFGVAVKPYEEIGRDVRDISNSAGRVWVDSATNVAITTLAKSAVGSANLVKKKSPVALMKGMKNDAEIRGMIDSHVQDGFALSAFLAWLDSVPVKDLQKLSEVDVADHLEQLRAERPGFIQVSFSSISAVGSNGAVIHYKPEEKTSKKLNPQGMYLIDSGGHYEGGTTDVTRTVHFGVPSDWEKELYTRVLMGHVDLARAIFPQKIYGCQLDVLARAPLWAIGMDYRHGTGHGVGSSLAVHEAPPNISYRCPPSPSDVPFQPGMIVSDEPGCYLDGKFGIRIENLMVCVEKFTPHQFDDAKYLGFDMLTLVPYCRKLIKTSLLNKDQIQYINEYHEYIRQILVPMAKGDSRLIAWINHACAPIV